uniref:Proteasome assembly chaperone 1 isoform X1 n=1 Tax=Geotrypetes seraphini TaxID=260995 RepID=A0A6P8QTS6_GEOSA|nr:proteasome assembly chaperone 1 isoform X1 [Geotrypetes seraphini]XP_033799305.1 proteasome assembly chaperone 1 isoform X1 [Geotrypetes seraphini]
MIWIMPHTKRKGVIRGDLSIPGQALIDRFLMSLPVIEQGEASPAVALLEGATGALGLETSLPPPPNSSINAESSAGQRASPDGGGLDAARVAESIASAGILQIDSSAPVLENILRTLQRLEAATTKSAEDISKVVSKLEELSTSVQNLQTDTTKKFEKVDKDISSLQATSATMVKDRMFLQRKIEQLENFNRRLNIRVLNFPKLSLTTPMDLFKIYLIEILKMPVESIPPSNKIYYLPKKLENSSPKELDLINLTGLLETSQEEIQYRGTLLVSFVFEQDLNMIMTIFFCFSQSLFLGEKIWIFPDVIKSTQERRKFFLTMREETIKIGATCLLSYPCKCFVKYQGTKYVYFVPEQLHSFLDEKKLIHS